MAMIDFKAEAWSKMSLTTSPCALETIVVMELAPHSWQRTRTHTNRQKLIQRARERVREPETEDVGWVVQHGNARNSAHPDVHVARLHEVKHCANVLAGFGLEQVVLHHLQRELDNGSGVLDAPGR